ncbi:unnamed protein product, partial [Phaeothamnion confervicola]
ASSSSRSRASSGGVASLLLAIGSGDALDVLPLLAVLQAVAPAPPLELAGSIMSGYREFFVSHGNSGSVGGGGDGGGGDATERTVQEMTGLDTARTWAGLLFSTLAADGHGNQLLAVLRCVFSGPATGDGGHGGPTGDAVALWRGFLLAAIASAWRSRCNKFREARMLVAAQAIISAGAAPAQTAIVPLRANERLADGDFGAGGAPAMGLAASGCQRRILSLGLAAAGADAAAAARGDRTLFWRLCLGHALAGSMAGALHFELIRGATIGSAPAAAPVAAAAAAAALA